MAPVLICDSHYTLPSTEYRILERYLTCITSPVVMMYGMLRDPFQALRGYAGRRIAAASMNAFNASFGGHAVTSSVVCIV